MNAAVKINRTVAAQNQMIHKPNTTQMSASTSGTTTNGIPSRTMFGVPPSGGQLLTNPRLKAELRTLPLNNKTGHNSHTCRPRLILDMQIAAASARRQTSVRCARHFFVLEHQ